MTSTHIPAVIDGLACVHCGLNLATPGMRSVPAGQGPNGQIFACAEPCTPGARLIANLRQHGPQMCPDVDWRWLTEMPADKIAGLIGYVDHELRQG